MRATQTFRTWIEAHRMRFFVDFATQAPVGISSAITAPSGTCITLPPCRLDVASALLIRSPSLHLPLPVEFDGTPTAHVAETLSRLMVAVEHLEYVLMVE